MLKKYVIFVIICLCMGLCACSAPLTGLHEPQLSGEKQNVLNGSESGSLPDETEPPAFTEGSNENQDNKNNSAEVMDPIVEWPLLGAYSMAEYQELLKIKELPENFVEYEKLSMFGAFSSIVFNKTWGDYSRYLYTVEDTLGYRVVVTVEHGVSKDNIKGEQVTQVIATGVTPNDMRRLSDDTLIQEGVSVRYETGDLTYYYVQGELLCIEWLRGDILYRLSGVGMLDDYPHETSTVTGKMLNLNEAPAQVNAYFGAADHIKN